ncbi:ty3-gypsy retrotransposon protein, partial [Tanacetum coccineum]
DGIGAVLMQGNRPISYFSRKLGPRMRVAATYQKELFAIVEAVWNGYLRKGRKTKPKRQNRTRNGKAWKRHSQVQAQVSKSQPKSTPTNPEVNK